MKHPGEKTQGRNGGDDGARAAAAGRPLKDSTAPLVSTACQPIAAPTPTFFSEPFHLKAGDHLEVARVVSDHCEAEMQGGCANQQVWERKRDAAFTSCPEMRPARSAISAVRECTVIAAMSS